MPPAYLLSLSSRSAPARQPRFLPVSTAKTLLVNDDRASLFALQSLLAGAAAAALSAT